MAPSEDRPLLQWYAVIAVVAVAVRAIYVAECYQAPFFHLRLGDAFRYHVWAQQIAGGAWVGDQVFYQAPLYAYFLALIYGLLGESALVVRLVHLCLGSASCVFLAMAGRAFFNPRSGIVAGWMLAFYAPSIFLEGLLQKTALVLALTTGLLALLGSVVQRPSAFRWSGVALVTGLLALTRENALVFAGVIVLWILTGMTLSWRRRLAWSALFVGVLALVLLPVGLRNWAVSGDFQITTSQAGTNFYIGNHPQSDGTYVPLRFGRGSAEHERDDAVQLAEEAKGRRLSPREVSVYWFKRTMTFITEQPMDWARLIGRKFLLAGNAAEVADTEDQQVYAEWSYVLQVFSFLTHFGVLLPLAAFGLAMTWPARRQVLVLYLMGAAYAATVVLFYVLARYRFPLVPILTLFAAAGVVQGISALRSRRFRVFGLVVAGLAAVYANWPLYDRMTDRAQTYANFAAALSREPNRTSEAIGFFRHAIEVRPDQWIWHLELGQVLATQPDRIGEAIASYHEAIKLYPNHPETHFSMGQAFDKIRAFDPAIQHYRITVKLEPTHAVAHHNLGVNLARTGHWEQAIEQLTKALQLKPDYPLAQQNLERIKRNTP